MRKTNNSAETQGMDYIDMIWDMYYNIKTIYLIDKWLNQSWTQIYNFECFFDNVPTMMTVSNDEGYPEVFRSHLFIKMKEWDIVIWISVFGNSANVVNVFDCAKNNGYMIVVV